MIRSDKNGSCSEGDPLEEAETLIAEGRAGDAAQLLRARIDAGRGGLLARLMLVRALIAADDKADALEAAREATSLFPHVAQAAIGFGEALLAVALPAAAIAEFQRALRIDPSLDEARFRLGEAWLSAGEAEKALEAFSAIAPDYEPDAVAAKIAAAEAMQTRARSDEGYVRHLFDQFSGEYDARMRGQLNYRAPEILRELASLVIPLHEQKLDILDLGCGTGLSGIAFKDIAARLDGVDLSPAMAAIARKRGLYNEVIIADLETALSETAHRYDLILAADTFVYLGDLDAVFHGATRALRENGYFLFTVEKSETDDFVLGPKRRWRHSEAYLRRLAAASDFTVMGLMQCHARHEAGEPVESLAVALHKT
ncbi:MAG TPA: methyltransferase domain-containing protein [Rhizomicrobium sp.]